ncbi:hypothetical protein HY480_01700 [Candidatus Uhrbacteria bacterium]|nr:hypothetical protein [Candidatus Uhrbacteria bacterium]
MGDGVPPTSPARVHVERTRTRTTIVIPPTQRGAAAVLRAVSAYERIQDITRLEVRIGRAASFSAARGTAVLANALAYARGIPITTGGHRVRVMRPHYAAPPKITPQAGVLPRVDNKS